MKTLATQLASRKWIATLLAPLFALSMLPSLAHATRIVQTVWAEDFNDVASFAGDSLATLNTSEYWNPTYYSTIKSAHDWQFANGAYFADNGQGDGAIVLNEVGANGDASQSKPLASITLTGLIVGYSYAVNFDYWGDNAATSGSSYDLTTYFNGQQVGSYLTNGQAAGSLTSPHYGSFGFTATSDTFQLGFGQSFTGQGSPIVDNIKILLTTWATQDPLHSVPSPVPEPDTATLIFLGLLVVFLAHWISKRPIREYRDIELDDELRRRLFGDQVK
jgi:hypothetical protein